MPEIPPRQLAAWAVAAARGDAARRLAARARRARGGAGGGTGIKAPGDGGGDAARVVVHVAGEVHAAGRVPAARGSSVSDAVERAGGATRRADLSQVNLAAKVEDGRQILVPRRVPARRGGRPRARRPRPRPGQPVNLNTATLEQLDALSGVGPVTAQKIIDYREEHGGFGSVDELGEVAGIGDVRLASLREQVRV